MIRLHYKRHVFSCATFALAVLVLALTATSSWAVAISFVPVSNAGNAADTLSPTNNPNSLLFGSVASNYYIGTYEVTNSQYAEFLNAADPTGGNALSLYNTNMGSNPRGGISFVSGNSNGSKYVVKTNFSDKPVNYVSWFDAIRFTNWLHNGQGSGSTEVGSYTLNGTNWVPRNAGTNYWLPSENEWYKAAYYDPSLNSGSGGYWDFATQSNTAPTIATHDATGVITNGGANVANYGGLTGWNGFAAGGNVTTVGSALNTSAYGTYDQAGNVYEWNDTLASGVTFAGMRGGGFGNSPDTALQAAFRNFQAMTAESNAVGFRVASNVPEPSTVVLAVLGGVGLALAAWRKRRSK